MENKAIGKHVIVTLSGEDEKKVFGQITQYCANRKGENKYCILLDTGDVTWEPLRNLDFRLKDKDDSIMKIDRTGEKSVSSETGLLPKRAAKKRKRSIDTGEFNKKEKGTKPFCTDEAFQEDKTTDKNMKYSLVADKFDGSDTQLTVDSNNVNPLSKRSRNSSKNLCKVFREDDNIFHFGKVVKEDQKNSRLQVLYQEGELIWEKADSVIFLKKNSDRNNDDNEKDFVSVSHANAKDLMHKIPPVTSDIKIESNVSISQSYQKNERDIVEAKELYIDQNTTDKVKSSIGWKVELSAFPIDMQPKDKDNPGVYQVVGYNERSKKCIVARMGSSFEIFNLSNDCYITRYIDKVRVPLLVDRFI